MTEHEKKPEKIDVTEFLGSEAQGAGDSSEIELLDPSTGAPARRDPGGHHAAGSAEDLSAAMGEREKYYDLWIRSRADFENFKKRIERERSEERAQAGASLIRDILPVLDNLERALGPTIEGDPFREGVALIYRQLRDCLQRAGVEPIESVGNQFDPIYHEAVITERTDRFDPNMVMEEIQRGYKLKGRVLRPALVKVAVKPEANVSGPGTE